MKSIEVLKSEISAEIENLKRLVEEASGLYKRKASNINIRAGGSILHDFYSGIERVFHSIAATVDERIPSGISWHIELLNQMTLDIKGIRSPVISKNTAKMLEEYLRFRHLFRKRYGFDLEWPGIKRLLKRMPEVVKVFEEDIRNFLQDN